MLKFREIVLIALLVSAIWLFVFALQLEPSAYHQICDTNQYTGKESCAAHNFLYVGFWYGGYVFNSATITALATGAIAYFTWTIKRINDGQLSLSHQVERAYVFARVVLKTERISGITVQGTIRDPEGVKFLDVVLDNHGKTPAYVSEIAISICFVEELPKGNELSADNNKSTLLANISLGPNATEIPTYRRRELRNVAGRIMYGRVYYTDIFGESHSSGFIYRIHQNGRTAPVEAAPEYTAWD